MIDTVPGIRTCMLVPLHTTLQEQESTKYSPFELIFGRKPVLPVELDVADESPETLLSDFNTRSECSQPLMDKMIEVRYETFLIK